MKIEEPTAKYLILLDEDEIYNINKVYDVVNNIFGHMLINDCNIIRGVEGQQKFTISSQQIENTLEILGQLCSISEMGKEG